ncbi:LysR family transcriptional regulator [Ruegeria jejuensis]|uniref:LysR family transcriptional regulator n=1 Tax=Ruegeria jejuensis TaxID=3233338 RepID=UPI00355AEC1D
MTAKPAVDLRLLAYFHKTAEIGNITSAAAALNVAQPTLSKAIQQLERQLAATLFQRSPTGVVLTREGEQLLRHTRLVLAQVSDAVEEIEALRSGTAGRVRIGAGPSWVRRILPDVVAEALRARPGLQVSISSGFDERMLEALENGELDYVVAEEPQNRRRVFGFEELTEDELVVCARAGHPLVGQRDVPTETVLAMAWALPPQHVLARRKLDGQTSFRGHALPEPQVTSTSLSFLLQFVAGSDALIYTTRSLLGTAEGSGLVEIDVPELVSTRTAGLIYRKPRLLTAAAEFVAQRLKARCAVEKVN